MADLRLTLLGGFEALGVTRSPLSLPTRKVQALMAYLALPPGRAHRRDRLAGVLWADVPRTQARNSLRQAVFMLRAGLPRGARDSLRIERETVTLDANRVEVDVVAFERLAARDTSEALAAAAELYRGELLEGFTLQEDPFAAWLEAERERLRQLALVALDRLVAHQRQAGIPEAAVRTALRLLALDPTREAAHRALMQLYVSLGRRDAAMRQYHLCVETLHRHLGVEAERETRQLFQDLVQARGAPGRGRAPSADPATTFPIERARAETVTEPPLTGRGRELASLHEAQGQAFGGKGQVVIITGETGIGKSRLAAEVSGEAGRRGARVLAGRCYESERMLAFGPWIDALRGGGVHEEVETLDALGPVWRREISRLLPELALPGDVLLPAGDEPRRLFEAVLRLIARLAAATPLLWLFEDLHWADEMSLRLLAFLGRRLAGHRVLFVATAREEEMDDGPILRRTIEDLELEGHGPRLRLGPLSRQDTQTLVDRLAAGERAQLGEQIWTASGGNPFIVVESLLALQDGAMAPVAPRRVQEVIARRLERLTELARALAAVAAVIGRDLEFRLLGKVADFPEAEVASGIEELFRRRVLRGAGDRLEFTHPAIAEVARSQISRPRSRLIHRRVADALESLNVGATERLSTTLGQHYLAAEEWSKARQYLWRAGTDAAANSAYGEAVALLGRALGAAERVPDSREAREAAIDIRCDLHNPLVAAGDPERDVQNLREAEALAAALGDERRLGRVVAYATNSLWLVGDLDRAADSGRRAAELARAGDEFSLEIMANFYLGQVEHFRGHYRGAITALRRNVEMLDGNRTEERFGLPGAAATLSRGWLVWSLAEIGEFAEGVTRGEEALSLAAATDHAFTLVDACREVGYLHLRRGDLAAAITILARAWELCRTRDLPLWVPSVGAPLGYAYALAGRLDEAVPLLEEALKQGESLGIRAGHALRTAWLAEASLLGGQAARAAELAESALATARERKERGHEAWALRLAAAVHAQRDPSGGKRAEEAYREALSLAGELEMRPLVAHCQHGLGMLRRRQGRRQEADRMLASAAEVFGSMGMTGRSATPEPDTGRSRKAYSAS